MEYRTRTLAPEEWNRLREFPPWNDGRDLPNSALSIVQVVENEEGVIVGAWLAINVVMLECFWVEDRLRQTGRVGLVLLEGMLESLRARGVPGVMTNLVDPAVMVVAQKVGFHPAPGQLHLMTLTPTGD